ncbi:MAG: serine/threonine-protein kinase [Planctomycetota bacterium]
MTPSNQPEEHSGDPDLEGTSFERALDRAFEGAGSEPNPGSRHSALADFLDLPGDIPSVSLRDVDSPAGGLPPLATGREGARTAGKYVIQDMLGRGGVGVVHQGHDQDLGRHVALKFLQEGFREDPAALRRFVEEAQIGGQLQHPGIVPVYELSALHGRPFFSMKLVRGETLAKKLAERGSPAANRRVFLSVFEQVCQTMAYAHARGVVHRDLKR